MHLRAAPSPLLLLLLSPLVASLTPQNPDRRQILEVGSPAAAAGGAKGDYANNLPTLVTALPGGPTVKPGVGTKDAPVDGLDGKPHAGPFVDVSTQEKAPKKLAAAVEDLEKPLSKSLQKLKESGYTSDDELAAIPEKNNGVMDDTSRATPKKGTTGTEGGVSERTRKDKTLEGKLGSTEKTVEPPKEAPPLPHSEQEAMDEITGLRIDKVKDRTVLLTGKPKGAQGLEVR